MPFSCVASTLFSPASSGESICVMIFGTGLELAHCGKPVNTIIGHVPRVGANVRNGKTLLGLMEQEAMRIVLRSAISTCPVRRLTRH